MTTNEDKEILPSAYLSSFESDKDHNPKALVDELESIKKLKIRGNMRRVLEKIGEFNLKKKHPTIKDVGILGLSYENKKKIIARAKERGLVVIHPQKDGNSFKYALSNMQDFEIKDKLHGKIKPAEEAINVNEILKVSSFYIQAVDEMLNHTTIEFHHIVISTDLNFKDEYQYFDWKIPSRKNKAKVCHFRLAGHRKFNLTLYPNGRMMLIIESSKHPFNLFSYEGLMDFNITCGQILQTLAKDTHITPLLSPEPAEWKVMQIDGAYDIPVWDLQKSIVEKIPVEKGGGISFRFPGGYLKVKHLNQLYQIYTKRLPYKGNCLRLENRLAFKHPYPTLGDIKFGYLGRKQPENQQSS